MPEPVIVSWSGGKDSALALAALRAGDRFEPVALLTTVTSGYDRISIHGVQRALLHAQAQALGLPLHEAWIEPECSNEAYEESFAAALDELRRRHPDARRVAFGDLFLEDVRGYREQLLARLGFEGVFPVWGEPTDRLARTSIAAGYEARLVCVDTTQLPADFVGRAYDGRLLEELPAGVDPCGERGEFHTFVSSGPGWSGRVEHRVGESVLRGRFAYCDLLPVETEEAGIVEVGVSAAS
ncbi:MAG TPA: hypothetical protein VEW03_10225 [Longimicrobiaceae bacterium]|nr:hypothetical protein [Longimicrobiaceae bacterium]